MHHRVFGGRVSPDVLQPSVPFWGNLRGVIFMLSEIG